MKSTRIRLCILAIFALVLTGCPVDTSEEGWTEDLELLWAATYGDPENGSYSQYGDGEVANWRSRYQYRDLSSMDPASGVGDCGTDVNAPIGVFSLNSIFLFNSDGQPLGPPPQFEVLPLPIDLFPPQRQDDFPDIEQTLEPIRLPVGQNPTQADFIGAVNELLNLARTEGGIDGPTIGLDYVLSPSMFHGHGNDDPTPAPEDAVSAALGSAADASSDGERTIWVVDYGLPQGTDESGWPSNISGSRTQAVPTAEPLTPQYGHGLMVASVAAQAAPTASVEVIDVADEISPGNEVITVSSLDRGLLSTGILQQGDTGILNFSIGAYDCLKVFDDIGGGEIEVDRVEEGLMMQALKAVLEPYAVRVPMVAAAGNDATDVPLYPAFFEDVVAVGALDDTVINTEDCLDSKAEIYSWSAPAKAGSDCDPSGDPEAPFNNRGPHISEFRAGVDLVVHYPLLEPAVSYEYRDDIAGPADLDTGKVRISGTSLAAPLYAACLLPDGTSAC